MEKCTTQTDAGQVDSLAGLQGACEEAKHVAVALFHVWVLISQAPPLGPTIVMVFHLNLQGSWVCCRCCAHWGWSALRLAEMWRSLRCLLGQKTDGQDKAFLLWPVCRSDW